MSETRSKLLLLAPVAIFAVVAGFFAIALTSGDPSKVPSNLIGKPVPETVFPGVEGLLSDSKPVPGFASADLAKGKVTVVNFWASWCGPCVDEHPLLADLKIKSGVEVYGVNHKDQAAAARRFLGSYGNPYTAVGTDASGRSAIDWGVYGMPETFVVDGAGRIVYKHVGPLSPESIAAKVVPAIREAAGTGLPVK